MLTITYLYHHHHHHHHHSSLFQTHRSVNCNWMMD